MVDRDAVRRGYDRLAEAYAAQRSADGRGMEILESFLGDVDPSRVLDAGCGQGEPVLSMLETEAEAIGLDVSRGQLRLAADATPDAGLLQGEMTALPFEDGAFDAVVSYWSLIHVPMADHRAVFAEFARVLGPGGHVLLCEGTDEWAGENPDWLDTGVEMQWDIAGADATREQLRSAGFRVVETWGVGEPLAVEQDGEDAEGDGDGDDATEADEEEDAEAAWTFFAARLEA